MSIVDHNYIILLCKSQEYSIESCPDCGSGLEKNMVVTRYIEDMTLPSAEHALLNKTTKQHIQKWYCPCCKKRKAAVPLSSQVCSLWVWVKAFVVYAYTILRFSYAQIQGFLQMFVHITVSDGEIVHILKENASRLRPEYEAMKERIRKKPCVHYDETVWNIQDNGWKQYARVMSDVEWKERVYVLWETRSKSVVEELRGNEEHIGISDDYNAYTNTFTYHQLCWAHPIRKLRDLKDSTKLNNLQHVWSEITYVSFCAIHDEVKRLCASEMLCSNKEVEKIRKKLTELTQVHDHDVLKMKIIKQWIRKNIDKYLTCLKFLHVPTTNNTAERVLRPLVIKRKLSFWSKTHDGATMMEVLYSVMYSLFAKFGNATFTHFMIA
jgi:transposase